MKRVIMCILWFIGFSLFFGIIGGLLFSGMNPNATGEASMNASDKYSGLGIGLALILAILGTITGKLPGTKEKL